MDTVVEAYVAYLAGERRLAHNTLLAYRRDLRRYLSYLAQRGVRVLSDVRVDDVSAFGAALRAEALSDASVARAVVAVRGLHRFALCEGRVAVDVARDVQPPAPAPRQVRAPSVECVQALLDAAGAVDPPYGPRDRALLELLYGAGARISEAVGLDLDDLDPTERTIRLRGGGGRERVVPLGAPAADALATYLLRSRPDLTAAGRGSSAVFLNARGGRLSRQSGWAILKSAAEQAKLSDDISPHTLRDAFATHLLDGGADVRVVQELLGHAAVTTTRVYASVTLDALREVYAGSHPRALD